VLEHLPAVGRRYFELDRQRGAELFVTLFSDDATRGVQFIEAATRRGFAR
jgi:hypothetical protein